MKFPTSVKEYYSDIDIYKYDKLTLNIVGTISSSEIKLPDCTSAKRILSELSSDKLVYCDKNFYYNKHKLDNPITYEDFIKYNIPSLWHFDGFDGGKLVYHHTSCGNNRIVVTSKDDLPKYCGDHCILLPPELKYKNRKPEDRYSYRIYCGMLSRCYNIENKEYKYYGAKGIFVCKFWIDNPWYFIKWFSPKYFDGCSIDRIDPRYEYAPYNCQVIPLKDNVAKAVKDAKRSEEQLCSDKVCFENRKNVWINQMVQLGFNKDDLI